MAEDVRTRLLQRIHDLQSDYHQAVKTLDEFGELAPHLYAIWSELIRYGSGDDPHRAVYLIGRAQVKLEPFARVYDVIEAYNEAQKKLEQYEIRRSLDNG